MDDKTALGVIDTQVGMFETPGVPPVPDGERLLRNVEGLTRRARESGARGTWDTGHLSAAGVISHHNRVMVNGFSEVVPAAEIRFGEAVGT